MTVRPNLLVIRSADLDRAGRFYEALGLAFRRERHGNGPEHLACDAGGFALEIYPRQNDGDSTAAVRLGFAVPDVDAAASARGVGGRASSVGAEGLPVGQAGRRG